jgi:hypothetical protein
LITCAGDSLDRVVAPLLGGVAGSLPAGVVGERRMMRNPQPNLLAILTWSIPTVLNPGLQLPD